MAKTGKQKSVLVAFDFPHDLARQLDKMASENLEPRATMVRRIVLAEMKRRGYATTNRKEDEQ